MIYMDIHALKLLLHLTIILVHYARKSLQKHDNKTYISLYMTYKEEIHVHYKLYTCTCTRTRTCTYTVHVLFENHIKFYKVLVAYSDIFLKTSSIHWISLGSLPLVTGVWLVVGAWSAGKRMCFRK